MADFLFYFLKSLIYTIGAMIVCGIIVYIFNRVHSYLIGDSIGYKYLKLASYIGTPIHELGHAIMCLFFGHKIVDMKFYDDNYEDNTLGYVKHSYNKKSIFQQIGNLFIGLGPIFSGVCVIGLILFFCYREPITLFVQNSIENLNNGINYLEILLNTFLLIPSLVLSETNLIIKIISFLVILSISLHIHLSTADIKNSFSGLLAYIVLVLVFCLITFLASTELSLAIISALEYFCLLTTMIFSLVIVFSFINVVIAFIIYLTKHFIDL